MASGMSESTLLTDLLRDVSRSFYLTLRVLPAVIRPQIGLAYLLARATDTIADTILVPVDRRLAALQALQTRIQGSSKPTPCLDEFLPQDAVPSTGSQPPDRASSKAAQTAAAERRLLRRIHEAIELLDTFPADDQQRIRAVLAIITSGQELDLTHFAGGSSDRIIALNTDAELDDYTYRVAGCVGEFWTRTCRAHLFPRSSLDDDALLRNGVRFGKGLQLVNVLRDLPDDLRRGRCYLPAQSLRDAQLTPETLLAPASQDRLRPVLRRYREVAAAHLAAGWAYTRQLPWSSVRVRLACAWPLLIGIRTLTRLERNPAVTDHDRVKITRGELRWVIAGSLLLYPIPMAWNRLFPSGLDRPEQGSEPAEAVPDIAAEGLNDPELGRGAGGRGCSERL
jgi:farnesyl-diphosphate farnesyltransferase